MNFLILIALLISEAACIDVRLCGGRVPAEFISLGKISAAMHTIDEARLVKRPIRQYAVGYAAYKGCLYPIGLPYLILSNRRPPTSNIMVASQKDATKLLIASFDLGAKLSKQLRD